MVPSKRFIAIVSLVLLGTVLAFAQNAGKPVPKPEPAALITFVELGSVKCVPCRMMQPVMKNIETKYGSQIKVVFYDIWKEDQQKYAKDYGVRVIPTQVFLDKSGKELFRHEGFFPESEIDALLNKYGLKASS
ncbi:thioredoxin [bacterium]|nr:MAG: thioredoxin [bacterium]